MGLDVFSIGIMKTTSMANKSVKVLAIGADNTAVGAGAIAYAKMGSSAYQVPSGKKLTVVGYYITGQAYGDGNGTIPPTGTVMSGTNLPTNGVPFITPIFCDTSATYMSALCGYMIPCHSVVPAGGYIGFHNQSTAGGIVHMILVGIEEPT